MKLHLMIIVCAALLAPMCNAQETFVAQSPNLTVEVNMPRFHTVSGSIESRQSGEAQNGSPVVIDEIVPANESFDAWTSLFAIMIEEKVAITLDQYVSQQIQVYLDACDVNAEDIYMLDKNAIHMIFMVPCPHYLTDSAHGEVAVFFVRKIDEGYVKIYQHWRGLGFALSDPDAWPMDVEALDGFLSGIPDIKITRNN